MNMYEDLEYWGIDKLLMEPCCAFKYYPELEISQEESKKDQNNRKLEAQKTMEEDFGLSPIAQCRTFLWNLTEYPERSKSARVRI